MCRTMTPPRLSPSKELLEAPIWTTWARYFSRVTQAKVLKYAHEIASRGLQVSCCPPAREGPHLECLCAFPQCTSLNIVFDSLTFAMLQQHQKSPPRCPYRFSSINKEVWAVTCKAPTASSAELLAVKTLKC